MWRNITEYFFSRTSYSIFCFLSQLLIYINISVILKLFLNQQSHSFINLSILLHAEKRGSLAHCHCGYISFWLTFLLFELSCDVLCLGNAFDHHGKYLICHNCSKSTHGGGLKNPKETGQAPLAESLKCLPQLPLQSFVSRSVKRMGQF